MVAGQLAAKLVPTDFDGLEGVLRSAANRIGAAMTVSLIGFILSAVLGLYMLWKIIRTPGEL